MKEEGGSLQAQRSRLIVGLLLLLLGLFLMLDRFVDFRGGLLIIFMGIGFAAVYYITGQIGFLIPGCLLLGLGLGIAVMPVAGGRGRWESFVLFASIAAGFYLVSVLGGKKAGWWPLIPGTVFLFLGLFVVIVSDPVFRREIWAAVDRYWPIGLIVLGALVIVKALAPPKG